MSLQFLQTDVVQVEVALKNRECYTGTNSRKYGG